MRWVDEYLRYSKACRELAAKLMDPDDKRALQLLADGWAKLATERRGKLERGALKKAVISLRKRPTLRSSRIEIILGDQSRSGVLLINGQRIRAGQKPLALLTCLQQEMGYVVPYERLRQIMCPQKSVASRGTEREQMHLLREYMRWIRETLAAHNASCVPGVVRDVGYVLCERSSSKDNGRGMSPMRAVHKHGAR